MHEMSMIYLASILNFLAVVFILVYFGRKPFAQFLQERSDGIRNAMAEAESLSKDAFAQRDKWKSSWSQKDAYMRQQWDEAKAALKNQRERELATAKGEATRIEKDAELMGSGEIAKAKKRLQDELIQSSIDAAQTYLGGSLSTKDREKLVAEYMDLVNHG
jgi:F-type H+-transporting ATPase subunit b